MSPMGSIHPVPSESPPYMKLHVGSVGKAELLSFAYFYYSELAFACQSFFRIFILFCVRFFISCQNPLPVFCTFYIQIAHRLQGRQITRRGAL